MNALILVNSWLGQGRVQLLLPAATCIASSSISMYWMKDSLAVRCIKQVMRDGQMFLCGQCQGRWQLNCDFKRIESNLVEITATQREIKSPVCPHSLCGNTSRRGLSHQSAGWMVKSTRGSIDLNPRPSIDITAVRQMANCLCKLGSCWSQSMDFWPRKLQLGPSLCEGKKANSPACLHFQLKHVWDVTLKDCILHLCIPSQLEWVNVWGCDLTYIQWYWRSEYSEQTPNVLLCCVWDYIWNSFANMLVECVSEC